MDSLHGIKLRNDEVAARGQTLTFRKQTRQLVLNGEALTMSFLNRKQATVWATARGAKVSAV